MAAPTLQVRLDPVGTGRLRVTYHARGGQLGPTREVEVAHLAALGLSVHLAGELETLREQFSPLPHGVHHGEALCRWLFGDEAEQQALFTPLHQGQTSVATTAAVDLVLRTGDHDAAAQPWRLMAWQGVPLVQTGWIIQHHAPGPDRVRLGTGARVLIAAPPYGDDRLDTATHVERLKVGLDGSIHVRVARTAAELETALNQAWDVLYFYGHGSDDPDRPGILFPERVVTAADLASWTQGAQLQLLLLHCCLGGGQGFLGLAGHLQDRAAVVIGHATRIPAAEARRQAITLFDQVLGSGVHPARAITVQPESQSFAWMTPVVFSSVPVGQWGGGTVGVGAVQAALPADWALALDREPQRDRVLSQVVTHLLPRGQARALACVATGGPDDAVDRMAAILRQHVARSQGQAVRFQVPTPADPTDPRAWDEALRQGLAVPAELAIGKALLRALAEAGLDTGSALVLLDFGAHTVPPVRVTDWVRLCRRWASQLDADTGARLLCVYGLVVDQAAHDGLAAAWPHELELEPDEVRPDLLPRLQDLRDQDLLSFLREHRHALTLTRESTDLAAQKVFERLGRPPEHRSAPYGGLLGWLERAVRLASWWRALDLDEEPGREPSTISNLL